MQAFDLYAILPELVLLVVTCLLLVASVYVPERVTSTPGVEQDIFHTPRGVGFVYFFSIILLVYLIIALIGRMGDPSLVAMNGLFQSDPFSNLLKACSCGAVLISLIYSKQYLMDRALFRPDFIVLALLALLGQFVLISGANLLTLYLGLELMALPTYALVAMRHSSEKSVEAGKMHPETIQRIGLQTQGALNQIKTFLADPRAALTKKRSQVQGSGRVEQ